MSEVSSVVVLVDVEFKACEHCTFFVLEQHFNSSEKAIGYCNL